MGSLTMHRDTSSGVVRSVLICDDRPEVRAGDPVGDHRGSAVIPDVEACDAASCCTWSTGPHPTC